MEHWVVEAEARAGVVDLVVTVVVMAAWVVTVVDPEMEASSEEKEVKVSEAVATAEKVDAMELGSMVRRAETMVGAMAVEARVRVVAEMVVVVRAAVATTEKVATRDKVAAMELGAVARWAEMMVGAMAMEARVRVVAETEMVEMAVVVRAAEAGRSTLDSKRFDFHLP